jgi:glutathione S-transferase
MIELVTLPAAFGLRNVSPFCLKIEMQLTALGLEFDTSTIQNPQKAPKGKLPYLLVDGKVIADSELINEFLEEHTGGKVYAGLTEEQKAQGFALARLAEDHLYWLMVASRWLDEDWWPNIVKEFFGFVPAPLRGLVAGLARRSVRQTYNLHGLGRHSLEEQKGFAERDLRSLDASVPETGFLFGSTPGVFDFTVAGLMAGMYDQKPESWVTPMAKRFPRLQSYTERVQENVGVFGRAV